jgi:hypothetical protein
MVLRFSNSEQVRRCITMARPLVAPRAAATIKIIYPNTVHIRQPSRIKSQRALKHDHWMVETTRNERYFDGSNIDAARGLRHSDQSHSEYGLRGHILWCFISCQSSLAARIGLRGFEYHYSFDNPKG